MSKYSFDRMSPDAFEAMAQALLEQNFRVGGNLIQFGAGMDGAREATWTQPPDHPTYARPANAGTEVSKEWVFQVKYHDIGQRGWASARDTVVSELEKELHKIVRKYQVPCHAYVMMTNVPFTGARYVGTRDKVADLIKKWQTHVPEIQVWDAADLSRMLDANESVRTAYLPQSDLPGGDFSAGSNQKCPAGIFGGNRSGGTNDHAAARRHVRSSVGSKEGAASSCNAASHAAVRYARGLRCCCVTVQVGQMIMPLPAGMPSRLLEARKALPHLAERPRTRP